MVRRGVEHIIIKFKTLGGYNNNTNKKECESMKIMNEKELNKSYLDEGFWTILWCEVLLIIGIFTIIIFFSFTK